MHNSLTLVTYFKEEEINEIYQAVVEYSIRNYYKKEDVFQNLYQGKIEHAKLIKTKNIQANDEELKKYLTIKRQKQEQNLRVNKPIIELLSQIPLIILAKYFPQEAKEEEKVRYLVDFVTKYVTYSEDYYHYCYQTPPTDGYDFDFKQATPVDTSVEGMLVQGQGLCDDICNLIQHLGTVFHLPLKKIFVTYHKELHAINTYEIEGRVSFIDATRIIRGDKTEEECFLVAEEILNQKEEYQFEEKYSSITIPTSSSNLPYNMDMIVQEIKSYLPNPMYRKSEKRKQKNYS